MNFPTVLLRLLFYRRIFFFEPFANFLVTALVCSLCGPLRGEAPASQEPSDLSAIQPLACLFGNKVAHRFACPKCELQLELLGRFVGDEFADFFLLRCIKLGTARFAPTLGAGKCLDSSFAMLSQPYTHRAAMHFEHVGDLLLAIVLPAQPHCLPPNFFLGCWFE